MVRCTSTFISVQSLLHLVSGCLVPRPSCADLPHKGSRCNDQAVILRALSILKQSGLQVPLVRTGLASHNSDPNIRNMSEFFQVCARLGLMEQVHLLGDLPYTELVSIMRCATLIVYPSAFEGWSISIEDAKALGRPLICSNIPIHREQAPDALVFFDSHIAEQLAALLAEHFPQLSPGPSFDAEANALAAAKSRSLDFGKALLAIGSEAAQGVPSYRRDTAEHSPLFARQTLASPVSCREGGIPSEEIDTPVKLSSPTP
jgi:hypothetical protein